MSDSERDYPSTEKLAGLRKAAVFYFTGGVILALLQFIARPWIIASICGVIICAVGIGWLMANNPVNKRTGALIIAVGIIVALAKTPIKPLTVVMGILLGITMMGFFALGIKNLIMYFIAQNKRY
jgi:uncharacterized membrane protein YoaK (UPF0700 family)